MNKLIALTCFVGVLFNCFLTLTNYPHIFTAFTCLTVLLMCGVIEKQDLLIAKYKEVICELNANIDEINEHI